MSERERARRQAARQVSVAPAAVAVPGRGPDVRYLAATNIAHRDNFRSSSVLPDELVRGDAFERGDGWTDEDEVRAQTPMPTVRAVVDSVGEAASVSTYRPPPNLPRGVRYLSATNIAHRDNFVETAQRQRLPRSSGFEPAE